MRESFEQRNDSTMCAQQRHRNKAIKTALRVYLHLFKQAVGA